MLLLKNIADEIIKKGGLVWLCSSYLTSVFIASFIYRFLRKASTSPFSWALHSGRGSTCGADKPLLDLCHVSEPRGFTEGATGSIILPVR